MKSRLDQISIKQFIELACGDTSVLLSDGEDVDAAAVAKASTNLLRDFKRIALPSRAKMDMLDAEDGNKLVMKEKCLRICMALCDQGKHEYAKEVLAELEVNVSTLDTPDKVARTCKAMLNDVVYEVERMQEHLDERKNGAAKQDASQMRNEWYKEVAWVMTVFKMSIDVDNVNACVYANLVFQASERMKQLAKAPRGLGSLL